MVWYGISSGRMFGVRPSRRQGVVSTATEILLYISPFLPQSLRVSAATRPLHQGDLPKQAAVLKTSLQTIPTGNRTHVPVPAIGTMLNDPRQSLHVEKVFLQKPLDENRTQDLRLESHGTATWTNDALAKSCTAGNSCVVDKVVQVNGLWLNLPARKLERM